MMKGLFLLLLGCLFVQVKGAFAQQKIVLAGTVQDETKNPVASCKIQVKSSNVNATTNQKGEFLFPGKFSLESILTIYISDLNYASYQKELILKRLYTNSDTIKISIFLKPSVLDEVNIYGKPEIVFSSDKLNVSDWEYYNDKLVLLTYEKRPGNNVRLVLTDGKQEELSTYLVQSDAKKIERDFEQRLHLICEEKTFLITIYEKQIYLLAENKEEYEKFIKPVEARSEEKVYFSNYTWHYPAFNYYAYNETDSSYKTLQYIEDKFLLDLYRAEYKYVDTRLKLEAYRMELRTGVDKEIWAAVWNGFPNSLYYKPVYAPMFVRNDSVLIFDHYSNQLFFYDESNEVTDSVKINYHLGKEGENWKKQLLMDDVTKKIYSISAKKGIYFLTELNALGQALKTTPLQHKYPEKIKVHNGYVYFNYRPFESQQNKYLYRQVLD